MLLIGSTGFLGKVTLSMLLHNFPNIGRVYVTVRARSQEESEVRFWNSVLTAPPEHFRRSMETNAYGPLGLCQALMPGMLRRRYGRIVNVSSGAGQLAGMTDYAPTYSVSKAALNALTLLLAHAGRGRNVLVNAVDPGWVRTDMGGASAPRSVGEGADTIVWCATLPDGGPTGTFFHDRKAIPW